MRAKTRAAARCRIDSVLDTLLRRAVTPASFDEWLATATDLLDRRR
jgi:hypothetical protein